MNADKMQQIERDMLGMTHEEIGILLDAVTFKGPEADVMTLADYLAANPGKLVRRFVTKKGVEMVSYIKPDGRNGQSRAADLAVEKIYLYEEE